MFGFWRRAVPLGTRGEDLAVRALRRAGYKILERNARIGRYEIDVIAQDHDTTAFVEVKARRRNDLVAPEENVHHTKRQHLRTAARAYISRQHDPDQYYRFDIVSVVIPEIGKASATIFRDAFR